MKIKVAFEMDATDYENLLFIINNEVVKMTLEAKLDENKSKEEKDWCVKHGKYVQKDILDKIIKGTTRE